MSEEAEKLAALLKIQEVTVVGILIVAIVLGIVAVSRGWVVVGRHHADTLAAMQSCLNDLDTCRSRVDQYERNVLDVSIDLAREKERDSLTRLPPKDTP